jgi:uncharacterized protein YbjQ (UPF0145 family)
MVPHMQISYTRALQGDRRQVPLGLIQAATGWRATEAAVSDHDREMALRALVREAEEFGADGVVAVEFKVETISGPDQHGVPLRRVIASGEAVLLKAAA